MQSNDLVIIERNKDKGIGKVVGIQSFFNQNFIDVFFQETNEVFRYPENEVLKLQDPFERLNKQIYDLLPSFLLKKVKNEVQAMMTEKGVLSASNFRITPLPHQILTVDFVLSKMRTRCLIADEVGLGKTIEAAMIFEELKLRGTAKRVLIVTPSGLTAQWKEELFNKFNEDFVVIDRQMFEVIQDLQGKETNVWEKFNLVITSLDFIKPKSLTSNSLSKKELDRRKRHNKYVTELSISAKWDVVIFDEAHKLSKSIVGAETARYKIGKALGEVAPVFLLLSATPHQGDVGRFYHLLHMLDPIAFSNLNDITPNKISEYVVRNKKRAVVDQNGKRLFKQRITDVYPIVRNEIEDFTEIELYSTVSDYVSKNYNLSLGMKDRALGFLMILYQRQVSSSSRATLKALQTRLDKLKAISLNTLTTNTLNIEESFDEYDALELDAQTVLHELGNKVTGIYNIEGLQSEIFLLENLVNLAKKASFGRHDSKIRGLLNIIDEICRRENNPTTKFLIFTEFVETQYYIKEVLEACGYAVEVLNGQMNTEEKMNARNTFKKDAEFLISTDAGGEGINLQFCHVIINYDLPWNPMKLEQRIGRLDRIGQKHNVLVFNFMIKETVEERVRNILEDKLNLIREQFGDDKLSDILSTLQDDFNFEKLFIDAVVKREKEALELETIAQQIYEKAKEILNKDELLLPRTTLNHNNHTSKAVDLTSEHTKTLVNYYLLLKGKSLNQYAKKEGVYHFEISESGVNKKFKNVVFDRNLATEEDSYEFLYINHPVVESILNDNSVYIDGNVCSLKINTNDSRLFNQRGIWVTFNLIIENKIDYRRSKIITLFIDEFGNYQREVAELLSSVSSDSINEFIMDIDLIDIKKSETTAYKEAHIIANDILSEEMVTWEAQLSSDKIRLQSYYNNQINVVNRIAIENIRISKLKELEINYIEESKKINQRATLIPYLQLQQVAAVMFG
jgi:SNF2 family DNA or RNA helicase